MEVVRRSIHNDVTITSKKGVEWVVEKLQSAIPEKQKATMKKQLTKYTNLFTE